MDHMIFFGKISLFDSIESHCRSAAGDDHRKHIEGLVTVESLLIAIDTTFQVGPGLFVESATRTLAHVICNIRPR